MATVGGGRGGNCHTAKGSADIEKGSLRECRALLLPQLGCLYMSERTLGRLVRRFDSQGWTNITVDALSEASHLRAWWFYSFLGSALRSPRRLPPLHKSGVHTVRPCPHGVTLWHSTKLAWIVCSLSLLDVTACQKSAFVHTQSLQIVYGVCSLGSAGNLPGADLQLVTAASVAGFDN